MVIRSAVGALGVVAVLGAVAVALPEHSRFKATVEKKDPPFGTLTKAAFVPPKEDAGVQASSAPPEAAKLLKLASVSAAQSRPVDEPAADKAQPEPPVAQADPTPTPAPAPVPPETRVVQPAPAAVKLPESVVTAEPAKPQVVAMVTPEQPPRAMPQTQSPPVRSKDKLALVDINKASEDALDHLPGAGRIGRSIVRHRPYRKVEDLLQKRVLRLSAFQKIQGMIKVD